MKRDHTTTPHNCLIILIVVLIEVRAIRGPQFGFLLDSGLWTSGLCAESSLCRHSQVAEGLDSNEICPKYLEEENA